MQKLIIPILLNLILIGFSFAETESSSSEIPSQLDDSEQDNLRQSFFQWMKQAAEQGDAVAQLQLALMYQHGREIQQDLNQAFQWMRKSAEQGDADAQFHLAFMYSNGEGTPQNLNQAFQWMRKLAEQGNAEAQYNLSVMYNIGEGVEHDEEKALYWLKKSADQGFIQAQDVLRTIEFAETEASSSEMPLQVENAKQAIWGIYDLYGSTSGTGFFIGTNHFITNFHVVFGMLLPQDKDHEPENQGTINHVVLKQKGNPSVLKIKKVLAVSVLYDLVLLETEENVTNYLSLRENPPESSENLFLIGYSNEVLTKIRKTGNIVYEDSQHYSFPTDYFFSGGASGSPVLDEQGLVTGVMSRGFQNIPQVIKVNHLRGLIAGNTGIKCAKSLSVAVRFFNKRCIEKDIENLEELAEKGSIYAQTKLAHIHDTGTDWFDWWDIEKAFQWYTKAAQQGYVIARAYLSTLYYYDNGQQDLNQAFLWSQIAAQQGYAPAQYNLAQMYRKGEGTPQDSNQAFQWYERSAQQGYAPAQYNLAIMYSQGESTPQDSNQAFHWFKKSAEQGNAEAQYNLSVMYHEGEGVGQNEEKAVYWLKKSAAQGFHYAQDVLRTIEFDEIESSFPEDENESSFHEIPLPPQPEDLNETGIDPSPEMPY